MFGDSEGEIPPLKLSTAAFNGGILQLYFPDQTAVLPFTRNTGTRLFAFVFGRVAAVRIEVGRGNEVFTPFVGCP